MDWRDLRELTGPGVAVHIAPELRQNGRIALSSGTRLANLSEVGEGGYEDGARLPRTPWRPLSTRVAEQVFAKALDPGRTVAIVSLPGGLSDARRLAIGERRDIDLHVLQPLSEICSLGAPLSPMGPVRKAPNLATVTINTVIDRFNGLHVDIWDEDIPIDRRHTASNRISINIGEADRYFLFLPIALTEIAALMASHVGPSWTPPSRLSLIGRWFMERYPDVPVVRCRVGPGEAYIAPTENLVHDASTEGQDKPDLQFTVRGNIRLRELPA